MALLRRHGASGAIVLPGMDGLLAGRRARLFASNANTPMVIVSVGPAEPLRRSLPHLHEVFSSPLVTLESIAQVKHDGELPEPPPSLASGRGRGPDVWQAIGIARRTPSTSIVGTRWRRSGR